MWEAPHRLLLSLPTLAIRGKLCGEESFPKSTFTPGCPTDPGLELWGIFSMFLLGPQIAMPHQWLEGNLPVSAKCTVCDKTCGSVLRLQDWRCLWCKAMVSGHHLPCLWPVGVWRHLHSGLCKFSLEAF